MRDRIDEFPVGTKLVVVMFSEPETLPDHEAHFGPAVTVVTDPNRSSYRAFGLGRGSSARVWGWRALRPYVDVIRRGQWRRIRRPREDPRQLGGDFVIDESGRLAWGYWSEGPDDRPNVDDLLAAAE